MSQQRKVESIAINHHMMSIQMPNILLEMNAKAKRKELRKHKLLFFWSMCEERKIVERRNLRGNGVQQKFLSWEKPGDEKAENY